ncbi:zinc ribbon domain-containing protein [Bacillaceae bacterium Marseille-Q3522]|nr:zinc ribbon domain-containing protein [Bacillaceae bacterium Marseille-Q3522]
MICPKCHHEQEGGKFCENCGAPLNESAAVTESAAAVEQNATVNTPADSSQSSVNLEKAKNVSKLYFSYFVNILKHPYTSTKTLGEDQYLNGIITVILFSILFPFMVYFGFGDISEYIDSPFVNIVLKPAIGIFIFIALIAIFTFAAIKLAKVPAGYKDVVAKFGGLLVPFVAIVVIGVLFAILQFDLFFLFLAFAMIGSIFVVPVFTIQYFKGEKTAGLDTIYLTLLVYLATIIVLSIIGRFFIDSVFNMIANYLTSLLFQY